MTNANRTDGWKTLDRGWTRRETQDADGRLLSLQTSTWTGPPPAFAYRYRAYANGMELVGPRGGVRRFDSLVKAQTALDTYASEAR